MSSANGWNEYQKLVLTELERLDDRANNMERELNRIKVDLAMLNLKSGIWGFAAGALPAIGALLYYLVKNNG